MEVATDASITAQPDIGISEEQRQKLRRLEVALIEYRESLEEGGIKNPEEIERKVAIHRKRLESEYGLSDSSEDACGSKRTSSERKDRRDDDTRDTSRKRHRSGSQSDSPLQRSSNRDREREHDLDRDRERQRGSDRDRAHDFEGDRVRDREKSGSREGDDHERDRGRERDRDRRRRLK